MCCHKNNEKEHNGVGMWLDEITDGCIYDTTDCEHLCVGCFFGINECPSVNNLSIIQMRHALTVTTQ